MSFFHCVSSILNVFWGGWGMVFVRVCVCVYFLMRNGFHLEVDVPHNQYILTDLVTLSI